MTEQVKRQAVDVLTSLMQQNTRKKLDDQAIFNQEEISTKVCINSLKFIKNIKKNKKLRLKLKLKH